MKEKSIDDRIDVLLFATDEEKKIIRRFLAATLFEEINSELLKDYDSDEERVILEFLDAAKTATV